MQYKVNEDILGYFPDVEDSVKEDMPPLHNAIDLTKDMTWHNKGFTIEQLFPSAQYHTFQKETNLLLIDLWRQAGLSVSPVFPLDQYHTLIFNQDLHLKIIDKAKLLSVEQFPLGIQALEERISVLLNQPLEAHNTFEGQTVFHFRIVRPLSGDNNPLHRDVWLEDYKDCINLYIPITGSNEKSSLILAQGSHIWPALKVTRTKSGAKINGQKFNVPAVTDINGDVEFMRPNPQPGEVLLFSPYLIHGGAVNLNKDTTRISIEIRLWRK